MTDELSKARALVIEHQRGSISLVQRHLRIGYNKAAALLETLEKEGVVGPMLENGGRVVLVPKYGEIQRLTGEAAVLRSLLRECDAVLAIVDPENDDEAKDLARLRQHIRMATGEEKGTLL